MAGKMTNCDRCDRRGECFKEGRLFTFNSVRDMQYDSMYDGKWGHGVLNFGEICPKWRHSEEQKDGKDRIDDGHNCWRCGI